MIARETRIIAVGITPVNIRDNTKMPVTFSVYRYPSGGGTIDIGNTASVTAATGKTISPDTDYTDMDQSMARFMVASAGTINVEVTDYES